MDLISREAVINIIHKEIENVTDYLQHDVLINVEFDVEELPTVEAVSVVRGEWISLEPEIGLFECSLCEHKILRAECNFCPNCGADMRKKV